MSDGLPRLDYHAPTRRPGRALWTALDILVAIAALNVIGAVVWWTVILWGD